MFIQAARERFGDQIGGDLQQAEEVAIGDPVGSEDRDSSCGRLIDLIRDGDDGARCGSGCKGVQVVSDPAAQAVALAAFVKK